MRKVLLVFLLGLSWWNWSCKENRLHVDVSEVPFEAQIFRLDSVFFETPDANLPTVLDQLIQKDSTFINQYFLGALNFGYYPFKVNMKDSLLVFAKDSMAREIYKMGKVVFGDGKNIKEKLTLASRHFLYHFPKRNIPRYVMYTTGSTYFAVGNSFGSYPYPDAIGVAIDAYLGPKYHWMYQSNVKLNLYQIRSMSPEYLVPSALRSLIDFHFPMPEPSGFLARALEEGKRYYALDACLPDEPDSIRLTYTAQQTEWIEKNQGAMWEYFISRKLLFSNDQRVIAEFFMDGPFTNADGVPQECPPKLGAYLGWKVISSFMEKHKDYSLEKMMAENRYEWLLKESGYKPK